MEWNFCVEILSADWLLIPIPSHLHLEGSGFASVHMEFFLPAFFGKRGSSKKINALVGVTVAGGHHQSPPCQKSSNSCNSKNIWRVRTLKGPVSMESYIIAKLGVSIFLFFYFFHQTSLNIFFERTISAWRPIAVHYRPLIAVGYKEQAIPVCKEILISLIGNARTS